jgi:Predicted xylanase/chitin deacetylase
MQNNKILKKAAVIIAAVLFLCGIFYLQHYMRRVSAPQIFGTAVRHFDTAEKVIALSFDDGPNPETTENILALLSEYNASATFFMLGKNAEKYPDIVKKVIESGNEIGNHTYSHERMTYKSPDFIKNEIEKTDSLLREFGYEKSIPFRTPYGHKLLFLPYYLMKTDRTHYLWDVELNDWESPPPHEVYTGFVNQMSNGSIVLLHDGYPFEYESRDAVLGYVRIILDYCAENVIKVVSIGELEELYIDR